MTDEPKYKDESWLREQYVDEWRSTRDIAAECDCSKNTIGNWLDKFGIETGGKERQATDERLTDREWLVQQYVEQERTKHELADECGCHVATIERWLSRHEIEKRGVKRQLSDERLADKEWLQHQYTDQRTSTTEIAEKCGVRPCVVYYWLENHDIETQKKDILAPDERLIDPEWLQDQYVGQEKSLPDIAESCSCSTSTVASWLNRHDIETRRPGYSHEGSDHPNWNGGSYPYGQGWTETKKRAVRERDGFTCQDPNCSVTQREHVDDSGEKLHVHHLRKARDIDDPEKRNAKENLITLCRDCHRRWEKVADAGLVPEVVRCD